MGWAAIIQAILGFFGPILSDIIKRWLDGLLEQTAAELGAPAGAGDVARLFDAAIGRTRRPLKRNLLRRLKAAAIKDEAAIVAGTATSMAVADYADLVDAVAGAED